MGQSVRRKPADQQWNADLIEKLVGTPWAPSPGKQKSNQEALELPEAVSIDVEQPAVEPKPVESAEMKPHFKRVYLRQTDFDKFGYSAQCRAAHYFDLVWIVKATHRRVQIEDGSA